jgi:hypothetical protein
MANQQADFRSMPRRALQLVTAPTSFFREMPRRGGFVDPLAFLVVIGVIDGVITALAMFFGTNPLNGVTFAFTSIIVSPIVVVIMAFIASAVLFVMWKAMGSREAYETSFRCIAYISAISPLTTLFGFVPFLNLVGLLWWFYLLIVASIESQRVVPRLAWAVFGVLAALFVLGSLRAQYATTGMEPSIEQHHQAADELRQDMERQAPR